MTHPSTKYYRTLPIHPAVNALPALAQVLLATLFFHRNAKTGRLDPKVETLARELNSSYSSIKRGMRSLREAGIVQPKRRQRSWQYEIAPVEEWHKPRCKAHIRQLRLAIFDRSEMTGQEPRFLNEQETPLKKETTPPPPPKVEAVRGGGGTPAALKQNSSPEGKIPPSPGSRREPPAPVSRPIRADSSPHVHGLPQDEHTQEARKLVAELAPVHPIAGNVARAVEPIAALLRGGETTVEGLKAAHARYRRLWAVYRPGRFIPQLGRWIQEEDWRNPPDDSQIRAATPRPEEIPETPEQREEREHKEKVFRLQMHEDDLKLYPWHWPECREEVLALRAYFKERGEECSSGA